MKTLDDFIKDVDTKIDHIRENDDVSLKLRSSLDNRLAEEIKGWKHAGSDLMKARAAAGKDVVLHSLKKDGGESGMHDARKSFKTEDEALAYHKNVRGLNPTRNIKHNLYVGGKLTKTLAEEADLVEDTIDELKLDTLLSYRDKAQADLVSRHKAITSTGATVWSKSDPLNSPENEKYILRAKGKTRAVQQLVKRTPKPVQSTTLQDPSDARGYGKGRYMGDSVEVDGDVVEEGAMAEIADGVKKHLDKHIKTFKDGNMDADTLGQHCVDAAQKIAKDTGHPAKSIQGVIGAHIDKVIGESVVNLDEYNSRHDSFEWVKGLRQDKEEAERKAAPPAVSTPLAKTVKTSAFAVMHHDGHSWKVSKHDDITGAAKEFARHSSKPGNRVKIVNHEGKVIHANHEAVELNADEMGMLQESVSRPKDIIEFLKQTNKRS